MSAARPSRAIPLGALVGLVAWLALGGAARADALVHGVAPAQESVIAVASAKGCRTVKVRLAPGARLGMAVLNGTRVGREFRGRGRVRTARLCARHGLRLGVNRLNLRARRGSVSTPLRMRFVRARQVEGLVAGAVGRGRRGTVAAFTPRRRTFDTLVAVGGRRVPRRYIHEDDGVWRARLSASSGLRHGRQRVRIRALDPSGRMTIRSRTVAVPDRSPIAGAGANQRVRVGHRIVLDGTDSVPARMAADPQAGDAGSPLTYSWALTGQPVGSTAAIADPSSPTTGIQADRPGTYLATLTVTDTATGLSSTDTLTATVTAQPLAPISTLATSGGAPGISIETSRFCGDADQTCFYANPGGSGTVQLLVLDRETLALASDSGIPSASASYPLTADGMDQLDVDLSQISPDTSANADTDLLVVLTLDTGTITDVSDLSSAVKRIGASGFSSSTTSVAGPFSIIGIPGMIAGKAWTNYGQSLDGGTAGSLDGYVKESAYYTEGSILEQDQRVFAFGDVRSYDTRVEGDGTVSFQVGAYDPTLTVPAFDPTTLATWDTASGGLGIATFDSFTLEQTSSVAYVPQSSSEGLDWSAIATTLSSAAASGDGVVITSLGTFGGFATEPDSGSFGGVLAALAQLGAQPDIFARAANTDGATYSFISSANVGAEASSVISRGNTPIAGNPVDEGGLTGALQRGSDGRFIVVKGDPAGLYSPTLAAVLMQAPIDWPYTPTSPDTAFSPSDDEQRVQLALAWLASCEATTGGVIQPRPELWTDPIQSCESGVESSVPTSSSGVDMAAVRDVALALRADYMQPAFDPSYDVAYSAAFPSGNGLFTESDFDTARAQLLAEGQALAEAQGWFATMSCEVTASCTGGNTVATTLSAVSARITDSYFADTTETTAETGKWAGDMFTHWMNGISKVLNIFRAESAALKDTLEPYYLLTGLLGDGGESFLTTFEGPNTSTSSNVDAWDILQNQLTDDTESVDTQIDQAIGLQAIGVGFAEGIVLSDWGRMRTVAANSTNSDTSSPNGWQISAGQLEETAPDTLTVQVRQNTWGAYAKQLWQAAYLPGHSTATTCYVGEDDTLPFREASPGAIPGLGDDRQYWPLTSISTSSGTASHRAYVVYNQSWIDGNKGDTKVSPSDILVPASSWTQIFASPTSTTASQTAAGQYPPWFWREYLGLTTYGDCNAQDFVGDEFLTSTGDFYGLDG